ncbi:hypothetical protein [Moraxella bovis]|uniref:hypothetical protein n=1 Tax=Moraxella bovis TaxID=476 RepID=UPI0022261ABF|nr:hypothetical protein [Moraxella bovis]UYZ71620.1 hypothetical protein LP089_04010 [Moraxella bovis]UYZ72466.1 hypothetical protein LP105_08650 [Moraxella bovis]UZA14915.1 hypothetical protein LP102_03950 [Moraxella bovis]
MKIETYKETYRSSVVQIPVPAEFQMGDFEVSFTKITTPTEPTKLKNQPNPALKGLMTFYGDIMSPTTDIEDWELD